MIFTVFTNSDLVEITKKKMPFSMACQLTNEYELSNRKNKKISNIKFYLEDEYTNKLYSGTMAVGSGYADHLFDHIKKRLSSVKLSPEKEKEKKLLLELLRDELPEELEYDENQENNNEHLEEKSENKRSFLKVVSIAGGVLCSVASIFFLVLFLTGKTSPNTEGEILLNGLRLASIQEYEQAVNEFQKLDYKNLEKQDKKAILFSYLYAGKAQKAIDLEPEFSEEVISYYVSTGNLEKIKEIDSQEPVIVFEQAFLKHDYQQIIELYEDSEINLNGRREEMVINSFLELQETEKALQFAKKLGNTNLINKVNNVIAKKSA